MALGRSVEGRRASLTSCQPPLSLLKGRLRARESQVPRQAPNSQPREKRSCLGTLGKTDLPKERSLQFHTPHPPFLPALQSRPARNTSLRSLSGNGWVKMQPWWSRDHLSGRESTLTPTSGLHRAEPARNRAEPARFKELAEVARVALHSGKCIELRPGLSLSQLCPFWRQGLGGSSPELGSVSILRGLGGSRGPSCLDCQCCQLGASWESRENSQGWQLLRIP